MKTIGLVNVSFSDKLGAGIGVFEDCSIPWHITYDEVINILEGQFKLQVGDKIYEAGPGDVLWVPRNTDIVYIAQERVTFFYSVLPAGNAHQHLNILITHQLELKSKFCFMSEGFMLIYVKNYINYLKDFL